MAEPLRTTGHGRETTDTFSRDVLDFPAIVELLRGFLSGPISLPRLATLAPWTDLEAIRRDLALAGEAREFLRQNSRPGFGALRDPRPSLAKLSIEGESCAGLEILAVLEIARAACDLRPLCARSPLVRLDELARGLPDFRTLVKELDGKILPDGSLDSSASPELKRLRNAIERMRQDLQARLEKLVERLGRDRVLQDAVVTLRNERFVIPVRAEEKGRVAGVVHGASSSGATVFVEPLETLPLNNELVELHEREFAEVQRILAEFSAKLRARAAELRAATEILSELDLAFAKAEFARAYDCCLPEFDRRPGLVLKDARHPVLEKALRARGRKPVPLTVELTAPKTLMLISGPNTGGKTVALKTVGVAVLMGQAGLPVAASEARLPVFERVLADIGDQQSMQANLSTFSAHVVNIQAMVEVAGENDLVLLDELGASTEPNEGAALAVAILEDFRQKGALTIVTTHYARLKAYAAETPEAVNAAMEFDEATLEPTYRLLMGLPGKSSGLDTARRLGLEAAIVERARGLLDRADAEAASLVASLHEQRAEFEKQIEALTHERKELAAERAALAKEFDQERRARLRELDARLEETLRQFEEKGQKALEEIRAREESAKAARRVERKAAELAGEAREQWNAQVLETLGAPEAEEERSIELPPAVGDRVRVRDLSTPGTVIALLGKDQLELEVGRLRMRVPKSEVRVLAARKDAAAPAVAAVSDHRAAMRTSPLHSDAPAEINVIGSTAEEARERVDKFLDEAYVAGRFRLRIIHGHGKGILKKTLHEMFASHPHVEKFYPAPLDEGGAGATIVELKM